MDWIIENWDQVLQVALQIIGAAAMIAALTKTPADDKFVAKLRKMVDVIGGNWGNAKNAVTVKEEPIVEEEKTE